MYIKTSQDYGIDGLLVTTESKISQGLPNITIVGLGSKGLEESRERIRGAFSSANIQLPKKKITINLSPSDIPKDGAHYDLPIALSIMNASNMISTEQGATVYAFGELGLDGDVRAVRGIIGKLMSVRSHLKKGDFCIVPTDNVSQARLIEDIDVIGVSKLFEAYELLSDPIKLKTRITERKYDTNVLLEKPTHLITDFNEVIGQERAKRALLIAAAGGHNILLNGPPGVGKSMLAKAMSGILPPLSTEDRLVVTHIHSLTSTNYDSLIVSPPFRSPHHTASDTAIIGGGQRPKPGEISLSHRGILFLDELPEFRRATIEALRQPMEDKKVSISRTKERIEFPCNFILVATQNPCPCGYYQTSKTCSCTASEIHKYQQKLSGPLVDRIDIHISVDQIDHRQLLNSKPDNRSSGIIDIVMKTRLTQKERFLSESKLNSDMNNKDIKKNCEIDIEAKQILDKAADRLGFSARVYMRILRVARTIADINNSKNITKEHITEAIQYRPLSKQ